MKFETLAKRVAQKSGCPPLEEALLKGDASLIPHESCFLWTGRKTQEGLKKKLIRDHNMRPLYTPVYTRPFPEINFNKKIQYVHRLVFDTIFGIPPGGRLRNFCGSTLCINPHHWVLTTPEIPEIPVYSTEWTVEDAVIVLRILDPDDPELEDLPDDIRQQALKELNL